MSSCQSISLCSVNQNHKQNDKPKLSSNWGFKAFCPFPPHRLEENTICPIACATFKELAEIHFENTTMPYLIGGVKESEDIKTGKSSVNFYDFNSLKTWLVHSGFKNPITRQKCEIIEIIAVDFFGMVFSLFETLTLDALLANTNFEAVEKLPFYKKLMDESDLSSFDLQVAANFLFIIFSKLRFVSMPEHVKKKCLEIVKIIYKNKNEISYDSILRLERVLIDHEEIHSIFAKIHDREIDPTFRIYHLQKAILFNPDKVEYYERLSDSYRDMGDTNEGALQFYELISELFPSKLAPLREMTELHCDNYNFKLALNTCEKALEISKGTNKEHIDKLTLANILLHLGHVQKAEEIALSVSEKYKEISFPTLAHIALVKAKYRESVSYLEALNYDTLSKPIQKKVKWVMLRLADRAENLLNEGNLDTVEDLAHIIFKRMPKLRGWALLLYALSSYQQNRKGFTKACLEKAEKYPNSFKISRRVQELKLQLETQIIKTD